MLEVIHLGNDFNAFNFNLFLLAQKIEQINIKLNYSSINNQNDDFYDVNSKIILRASSY
jgi:hypothetical protein